MIKSKPTRPKVQQKSLTFSILHPTIPPSHAEATDVCQGSPHSYQPDIPPARWQRNLKTPRSKEASSSQLLNIHPQRCFDETNLPQKQTSSQKPSPTHDFFTKRLKRQPSYTSPLPAINILSNYLGCGCCRATATLQYPVPCSCFDDSPPSPRSSYCYSCFRPTSHSQLPSWQLKKPKRAILACSSSLIVYL